MRRLLSALMLLFASTLAVADQLTILELHHQLPEQVLPTLRPLVAPGGTIVGANNQLFVRTTPENLAEIRQVLAALDQPLRRLLISVSQQRQQSGNEQGASLDQGRVVVGDQASVSLRGSLNSNRSNDSHNVSQQVQTLEGSPAQIYLGASYPVAMRQWRNPQGEAVVTDSIQYVDVGSGFYASARIAGDNVTLTITPSQQQRQGNEIQTSSLDTTLSGRLGEWLELGSSNVTSTNHSQPLAGQQLQQQQVDQQVWLKVELLP